MPEWTRYPLDRKPPVGKLVVIEAEAEKYPYGWDTCLAVVGRDGEWYTVRQWLLPEFTPRAWYSKGNEVLPA